MTKYQHGLRVMVAVGGMAVGWSALADKGAVNEPAWLSPSIGPLSPSVHVVGAVGDSSGDVEELAVGHHDPTREDGSVQGIELGASLRLGPVEGFATYAISYGAEEEWENEWEEAFLKLRDLPGGVEVRGGRMLGRYGQINVTHRHAWGFVDMPLVIGRFLGEHGLWFDGGDVTWLSQGIDLTYGLTVAYGKAVGHEHEHGDEGEHEEEGEDMDHEGEEHAEEHEHEEEIAFADEVGSARLFAQFRRDDFYSYESGLSLAIGDEEAGRQVAVYGLDVVYNWRENGLEPGGRALVWTTEVLFRDVDSGGAAHDHGDEEHADHEEEGEDHDHEEESLPGGSEFGFYSEAVYTLNHTLDLGTRVGYVEGNDELETEERYRISPAITAYLDPYRRVSLRTQYNYDDLADGSEEHTVWVQLGLSWGGAEVR